MFLSPFKSKSASNDSNAAARPIKGGFKALGYKERSCVVLSLLTDQVVEFTAAAMVEFSLGMALGVEWCKENYPTSGKTPGSFNHRVLAEDIMTACQDVGPYAPHAKRDGGVWLDDDGELIVNGAEVWRPDGKPVDSRVSNERVYTAAAPLPVGPATPPISDRELDTVTHALRGVLWDSPIGAEIILGWCGVAVTAAALRRRPHLLLTGRSGVGKSTCLELIRSLLEGHIFSTSGKQTLAGLAQSVSNQSKALAIDEFEAGHSGRAGRDVMDLTRSSYSLGESEEGLVRGTPDGKPQSYRFFGSCLAAAITPPTFEPADFTRWLKLEAKGRVPGARRIPVEEARHLGPRLVARILKSWGVYRQCEPQFLKAVLAAGGDERMAETVGTVLAWYYAIQYGHAPTDAEASDLVERFGVRQRVEESSVNEEQRCLDALLSRTEAFTVLENGTSSPRRLRIGEAIELACAEFTGQPLVTERLARLGLRVAFKAGKWVLYIVTSPEHAEMARTFKATKWAHGGWSGALRRLPGGGTSTQRIGAGYTPAKVVVIDVPQALCPAEEPAPLPLVA